jgi:TRAP-type C4-dicarboxylate transport system substrate-binding protein
MAKKMKNKSWKELSPEEKTIVKEHYRQVKQYCGNHCKNVKTFWLNHRDIDY